MFRYRVHLEDGSDAGEATYAQMIPPATRSTSAPARSIRPVPFEEEDESPFVGLLQVEAA
jgi:hypothetical protein